MTDEDYGEERDPLLVRPYIRDSDAPGDDPSTQTWPAATTREVRSQRALEGADDPTAVLFLPGAGKRKRAWDGRRRLLVVIAACAVLLIGAGAAGFAALRSSTRPAGPAALPDAPIPALTGLVPAAPPSSAGQRSASHDASGSRAANGAGRDGSGGNGTDGTAPGGTGTRGTGDGAGGTGTGANGTGSGGSGSGGTNAGGTGTGGTGTGGTGTGGTSTGGTGTGGTGTGGTGTGGTGTGGTGTGGTSTGGTGSDGNDTGGNTTAPAALAPKPADDRTGTIRGQNGLCLDLNGAVPVDFNHVQVYTCNGSVAQRWTLATDGTLRVMGMCALATGDGTVHITGCDGRTTAQWRADGQLLVNVSNARCLTDPSSGSASGTGVTVATCSGRADQRWSIP